MHKVAGEAVVKANRAALDNARAARAEAKQAAMAARRISTQTTAEARRATDEAERAIRKADRAIAQINEAQQAFQNLVATQAKAVSKDPNCLPLVLRVDRSAVRLFTSEGQLHEPTPEARALCQLWAMAGASKAIIAREIGITTDTLNRHYADELADAGERGVALVRESLFAKAIGGDMTAIALFLKVQGRDYGWVDRSAKEERDVNVNVQLDVVRSLTAIASAAKQGRVIDQPPALEHADDLI